MIKYKELSKKNPNLIVLNKIQKEDLSKLNLTKTSLNKIIKNELKNYNNEKIKNKLKEILNNRYLNLNNKYDYCLMGLNMSWNEIPLIYQLKIEEEYWDIRILLNILKQQLNSENMENPYPIFPNNPFNRKLFTPEQLFIIKSKIIKLNMKLDTPLNDFFNLSYDKILICYNQALNNKNSHSSKLIKYFRRNLRYKLINIKNSQDCFTGHWVSKYEKPSLFEEFYNEWYNEPYQQYNYTTNTIHENYYKYYLYDIISNFKSEII